ncbi:MAG TPA: DUF2780 domain-containing protein [Blastocatellia bacterium]|nr:DUF2780 domain-containing protein [Blastocatellia bacterium]
MNNKMRLAIITASLASVLTTASSQTQAQTPTVKNPSPELVGELTKELKITPQQATGGAGALFGLAKTRLKPDEFSQVSKAVPGMDGLLKAAPKPKGAMGSLGSSLPGGAGGLASVAGSFKSLGLSPDMASKFVPVLTKFVEGKGGANVASLLGGALK